MILDLPVDTDKDLVALLETMFEKIKDLEDEIKQLKLKLNKKTL